MESLMRLEPHGLPAVLPCGYPHAVEGARPSEGIHKGELLTMCYFTTEFWIATMVAGLVGEYPERASPSTDQGIPQRDPRDNTDSARYFPAS